MTELFQQLLQWVSLHPGWAHSIIFLVAMAESLAIVGVVVPGVVIMFGIGALISSGAIAFWPAMLWAVAGAITGDGFSFWLGANYREQLTRIWPFNRHPQSLERGIAFFERYGGKSVAIGRFFGPVRAVIPLVAGMMGMPTSRFILANVASALLWAPAYLLPGMVFGASLELASAVALRLVMLLLLLLALVWFTFALSHRLIRRLQPHSSAILGRLLRWASFHPYTNQIARALINPAHPEAKALSLLTLLLLIAALLFILLLTQLAGQQPLLAADTWLLELLQGLRTPWADHLMLYITRLSNDWVAIGLVLGVAASLWHHGHRRSVAYWAAAALFCLLLGPILKLGLAIPRPDIVAIPPSSYSFPSGHVLRATVLYGFLAVMIARALPGGWRWLPYSLAGTLLISVALSRLYLGVHWLSDVLGSITLGSAWVALLGIAYHHHTRIETRWRGLTLAATLSIAVAYGLDSGLQHAQQLAAYRPAPPQIEHVTAAQWWQPRDPAAAGDINVEYAGDLDWLRQQLLQGGWRISERLTWSNSLKLLAPDLPLSQLPALPQHQHFQDTALLMSKAVPDNRQITLRLWPSRLVLRNSNTPVWHGRVRMEKRRTLLRSINYAQAERADKGAIATLFQDLQAQDHQNLLNHGDGLLIQQAD